MPSTAKQLKREAEERASQTMRIFNPSTDDFIVKYLGKKYVVRAMEISEFPEPLAKHIIKHLANHILNKTAVKTNVPDTLKQIKEDIIA